SVPSGFIPPQDQGYVIVNVQLPDASSINRTEEVMAKMSDIVLKTDGVQGLFAVSGLSIVSFSNSSAAGVMFIQLKPFTERAGNDYLSSTQVIGRLNAEFAKVPETFAIAIPPPPVRGIGSAGGFKMQIQDRSGQAS